MNIDIEKVYTISFDLQELNDLQKELFESVELDNYPTIKAFYNLIIKGI